MRYNAEINRLRAVAVLMTLSGHLSIMVGSQFFEVWRRCTSGNAGVNLFLVISGFVISGSLLPSLETSRSKIQAISSFWIKRFTRIFPQATLWIVLTLLMVFFYNPGKDMGTRLENLQGSIAALLDIYNIYRVNGGNSAIMHYWTLSLEEQFYIFLPFLFVYLPQARLRFLFLALALPCMNFMPDLYRYDFGFEGLIFGIMWFEIWRRLKFESIIIPKAWGLLFFVVLSLMLYSSRSMLQEMPLWIGQLINPVISLVLVSMASLKYGFVPSVPIVGKTLDWLGTRSYALYIAHIPCFWLAKNFGLQSLACTRGGENWHTCGWEVMGIGVALALITAECSYRLVEEPIRIKGRHFAENWAKA